MSITTTNIKPAELNSFYLDSLAKDFDPYEIIKNEVVTPLFTPLIASAPAVIEDNGKALSADDITAKLIDCSGDRVDNAAETMIKDIFRQTLSNYKDSLSVQSVYAVQQAVKLGMPLPSDKCIYVPDDVIQSAKLLLSGQTSSASFFTNLAFYARVETFGYFFANDAAWSEFKAWFATEIQNIASMLAPETVQLCNDLAQIKLNHLTESFVLRDDDAQNNDPYSFARVFIFYLMLYEQQMKNNNAPPHIAGHMPFSFAEHFCPRTIVIVNVEKHAHAHPSEIKNEWDVIKAAMQMNPHVLKNNTIAKLTAVSRMANKMKAAGAMTKSASMNRSAVIRFRKTPPTSVDLYKYISRIYKNAMFVQTSENAVKSKKLTYQRPSRRDPDDPDRQGKTTSVQYKPDLHVYLDCSGSISERDYQDAIKACIKLAKKMNVNFYFNSFSHIMSESTRLPVQGKSIREIYDIFKNVPKVGGGTDYEQIWHYINKTKKREREVSIIISDFEYMAPNHYVKHPRYLYYAPISTSNWQWITQSAETFAKSMVNIASDIRKKILM